MPGTAIEGRSVITVPMEELQEIITSKAGSGKINHGTAFCGESIEANPVLSPVEGKIKNRSRGTMRSSIQL